MGSTRIEFKVPAIREQITLLCESEINDANEKYQSNMDLPARRKAWRTAAEQRFLDMTSRMAQHDNPPTDDELHDFSIKSPPSLSTRYGTTPEETRDDAVAKAEDRRDRRLARLEAMVKDPDTGSLWLTTSMLHDLFGL